MNRVTNIAWGTASGSCLGGFDYVYDALGHIVSRTHDLVGASFDRVYAYDGMDRLASEKNQVADARGGRWARLAHAEGLCSSARSLGGCG